ncbi:ABC transporter substrate-binding protein [Allomesorhizobium camelthorni]|uniref:ABC transporter substrate-binding protein n=1 Tax=Allomesorhizobium camelthorni TaxID=475069 RepID=A0A6G4WNM7_9HYPH|nr:ABC transporter substrate-binding protein [Mesorhizobium camelthorni]NGO55803.1 ABC transporter substrate-binding protein [Mesorhizobium camelthorni]
MSEYTISRRTLLTGAAATTAVLASSAVWAQQSEEPVILYGTTGGIVEEVQRRTIFDPFTAATGIKVVSVPYPKLAKVEAMVSTNTVDLDFWEIDGKEVGILGRRNLLEPIDYSLLRSGLREDLIPNAALDHGVGTIVWGAGIVYSASTFKEGAHPRSWADVWDVSKFPGPRTLPDPAYHIGPIEAALLADGVPADKLYPIDVDRAFASLDKIKPHIVKFWSTSPEGLNLMTSGNALVGMNTLGRVIVMKHEGKDPGINIEFNQAMAKISYWGMPKSAPHPKNFHRLLDFYLEPKNHAAFLNAYPAYGMTITSAQPYIDPTTLPNRINSPEKVPNLVMLNDAWWMEEDNSGRSNFERVNERWASWIGN